MNRLRLRAHLHSVAAVITAFCAAVPFRPAGGYATTTVNVGIEAPCTEDRIA